MNAQEVQEAERRRRHALVAGDVDELGSLLDDEVIWNHASGEVDSKSTLLDSITSGRTKYLNIDVRDEVLRLREDIAIINGIVRFSAEVGGVPRNVDRRFSIVWIGTKAGPKVINWHSTPIPVEQPIRRA